MKLGKPKKVTSLDRLGPVTIRTELNLNVKTYVFATNVYHA